MDLSWAQFVPAVIHGGFFLVFFGLKYTLDILEILGEIFQNWEPPNQTSSLAVKKRFFFLTICIHHIETITEGLNHEQLVFV
jgi:hypothetical protein